MTRPSRPKPATRRTAGPSLAAMAAAKRKRPGGRYHLAEITARVEAERVRLGIPVAQIARAVGMPREYWYKKCAMKQTTFSVEELGLIADEFQAPIGWPFLDRDHAEHLERLLEREGK